MLSTFALVLLMWFLVATVVSLGLGAILQAGSRLSLAPRRIARPDAAPRPGAMAGYRSGR